MNWRISSFTLYTTSFCHFIVLIGFSQMPRPSCLLCCQPVYQQASLRVVDGCGSLIVDSQSLWASEMVPGCRRVAGIRIPVLMFSKVSWVTVGHSARTLSPYRLHQGSWRTGHKLLVPVVLRDCYQMWMGHWIQTSNPCGPRWGFPDGLESVSADSQSPGTSPTVSGCGQVTELIIPVCVALTVFLDYFRSLRTDS